jgi:hypothetical protein
LTRIRAFAVLTTINAESRMTLRRFTFTLTAVLAWSALCASCGRLPDGGVATMLAIAGTCVAVLACLFRERFGGGALNRWDELAAFTALAALAHALG